MGTRVVAARPMYPGPLGERTATYVLMAGCTCDKHPPDELPCDRRIGSVTDRWKDRRTDRRVTEQRGGATYVNGRTDTCKAMQGQMDG